MTTCGELFNVSPYFDDFDEAKKFLRMLFRPGFAVQARELTQLQTILNSQIQRFASHVFEDGTKVVGADISDQNIKFLRVDHDYDAGAGPVDLVLSDFIGKDIAKVLTNDPLVDTLQARVLHAVGPGEGVIDTAGDTFVILFIEYTQTGTLQITFSDNYVSGEDYQVGETVFQGVDLLNATASAKVVAWSPAAVGNPGSVLYLTDVNGTFQDAVDIKGETSLVNITTPNVYFNQSSQVNYTEFQAGDELALLTDPSGPTWTPSANVKNVDVSPQNGVQDDGISVTGDCILSSIDEGIFYIDGFFVLTEAQRTVAWKPAPTPTVGPPAEPDANVRLFEGINARVGFDISMDIVTSDDDTSLLDPAFGSTNFNAPGADRYRIRLLINFTDQTTDASGNSAPYIFATGADQPGDYADEDFVEWQRIKNDEVVLQAVRPEYSALEDELARRTFDTNGSFTVRAFTPDVRPHLKKDLYILDVESVLGTFLVGETVTGVTSGATGQVDLIGSYTAAPNNQLELISANGLAFQVGESLLGGTSGATADISTGGVEFQEDTEGIFTLGQGGEEDSIAFGLEPGKAFVQGYEFETLETEYVKIDKGRDEAEVNNYNVSTGFGNYVLVDSNSDASFEDWNTGLDFDSAFEVILRDKNSADIGTARVRQLIRVDDDYYRLYIFDRQLIAGKSIGDVREINYDASTQAWEIYQPTPPEAVIIGNPAVPNGVDINSFNSTGDPATILFESGSSILLFPVPAGEATKAFLETDWRTQQQFTVTLNASGIGTATTTSPKLRFVGGSPVSGLDLANYTVIVANPGGGGSSIGDIVDLSAAGNQLDTNNTSPGSNGQVTLTLQNVTGYANAVVTLIATIDVNDDAMAIVRQKVLEKNYEKFDTTGLPTTNPAFKSLQLKATIRFSSLSEQLSGGPNYNNFDISGGETLTSSTSPNPTAIIDTTKSMLLRARWSYLDGKYGALTVGDRMTGASNAEALVEPGVIVVDASSSLYAQSGSFLTGELVFEGASLAAATAVAVALSPTEFQYVFGQFGDGSTIEGATSGEVADIAIEPLTASGNGVSVAVHEGTIFKIDGTLPVGPGVGGTAGLFVLNETVSNVANTVQIQFSDFLFYEAEAFVDMTFGAFTHPGETLTGGTSGAEGVISSVTVYGELNISDVTSVQVYDHAAVLGGTNQTTDIASAFVLDNGQRDNLYDHARIIYDPNSGQPLDGNGGYQVFVDYFDHQGTGPLFVNSYTHATSNLRYEDIPTYESPQSGIIAPLVNALDFRPIRVEDSTTIDKVFWPLNGQAFDVDYDYYLPRVDKIILRREKLFDSVRGISSLDAEVPPDDPEAMTLYTAKIPAYTYDAREDVEHRYIDNRRYTMRDIGAIERRVQRLEYYTSLSLLEQQAESLSVPDETGEDRFKNGILVDSFQGHGVGDVLNVDYDCSMDFNEEELRPPFTTRSVALEVETSNSAISISSDNVVTLDYTEEALVNQPLASTAISVNPFNVTNWMGSLTITPSSDIWVDTEQRPDVRVNLQGENDAWRAIVRAANSSVGGGFGTEWGEWENHWTGRRVERDRFVRTRNWRRGNQARLWIADRETVVRTTTTLTGTQTRRGIRTRVVPERIERELGNRVVDVSIVPFIRAQELVINAEGMKPNTRVYAFFDGVNVSDLCIPPVQGGFLTGTGQGDPIFTNFEGKVEGLTFLVPAGRFRTGERLFRLTDEPNNIIANSLTSAERIWTAQGLLQTREQTVLSTRVPVMRRQTVTQSRPAERARTRNRVVNTRTVRRWVDPLAQTFLVDNNLHPNGVFITSVDLFFRAKDRAIPVTVQIRPVNNGYPSAAAIIPFSEVTLPASSVNISDAPDPSNAATKTTFTFSSPVHLLGGEEYSIVVLSNSNEYLAYIATIGQVRVNSEDRITEQPYAGSLFKSQNASTWTADQTSDLMFVLNRAKFNTSLNGQIDFYNLTDGELATQRGITTPASLPNVARLNALFLQSEQIVLPETELNLSVATTLSGTGATIGGFNRTILANQREVFESPTIVNQGSMTPTFKLRAQFISDDDAVSPVMDLDRLSALVIENKVNDSSDTNPQSGNYNGELEPNVLAYPAAENDPITNFPNGEKGAMAHYITRLVTLEEGFESTDVRVFLTVNKRIETDIQVFVKVQTPEEEGDFTDERYTQLLPVLDAISENDEDDREIEYALPQEFAEAFNKFVVKVTLYSSNPSIVPRVRDLRAIAVI